MKKRKPLAGRSGGSANQPSRDRRDSQAAANTPLAFPLRVNAQGQLELVRHAQGAVGLDPSRGIFIIVHPPLKLVPGSPFGISIDLGPEVSRQILAKAAPTSSDVEGIDGDATLLATLNRFEQAFQAGDATIQAQIDAYPRLLAAGQATLTAAGATRINVGIDMTDGSFAITLTRATLGRGTGAASPYADPAEFDIDSFYVRSADPLDDADFYWTLTRYA